MTNKISLFLRQFRVYSVAVVGFCMYQLDYLVDWMTATPIIHLSEWQIAPAATTAATLAGIVMYAAKQALQPVKKDEADE